MLRNTCPGRERQVPGAPSSEVSNGWGLVAIRRYMWSPGKLLVLAALLASYACGSDGGGCGGCDCAANSPYPAQAPAVDNAVQVRLARPGLDFIENNLDAIVGDLLGTGLTFCVPEGQDPRLCDVRTCPSTGELGCELSLEIEDVQIDAVEPNQLNVTVTIGGLDPMTDFLEVNLLSNCLIRLGTDNGLPATLTATLVTDPTTGDVSVEIDPNSIAIDFDRLTIDIDGATILDFVICEGIDLATELDFLREILFGVVDGLLGDMIGPLLNEFLCLPCEQQADCPNGSQCADLDGTMTCVEVATGQCVPQPLGIETLVDLGALLSSVSPGLEAELNVLVKANGLAKSVNGGATIGFRGGTYADKAECVPVVPPPLQLSVPESTVLQGNMTPAGQPFHVGVGISKAFFDEALWGVFNSGALCLAVGTEVSDFISTGTFGLFLPSLGDLTDGNAPMLLRFEPSEPPTMNIGAGTIDPDTGELIEPLLTLVWPNLNIDFFAFIDQRMVRLFTLNTTLELPLGLAIGEEGLEILLPDDLGDLFQTVDVRNSEILTETPESLEATFPSLIDVALGLLGGDLLSPIALPDLAGFQLEVVELTGIEGNSMMGLFANLSLAPDGMNAEIPRTYVEAALVDLDLPDPALTQRHGVFDEEYRVASLIDDRPVADHRSAGHLSRRARTRRGRVQLAPRWRHVDGLATRQCHRRRSRATAASGPAHGRNPCSPTWTGSFGQPCTNRRHHRHRFRAAVARSDSCRRPHRARGLGQGQPAKRAALFAPHRRGCMVGLG